MTSMDFTAFACAVYGRPPADGRDCLAWLYGLSGAASLRPWERGETSDVRELARRDYQPEHGAAWEAEWTRQREESFAILEGRMGEDWPVQLAVVAHGKWAEQQASDAR